MANITKTPVMVLQELIKENKWPSPEFKLIAAKQGSHTNMFMYEVNVRGFIARGSGLSKQRAKHQTATNMLDILKQNGLYKENSNITIISPKETDIEPSHNNIITLLREVCFDNHLPDPKFVEISDVGPPHCREFTYECQLGSLSTRGLAGTKKQAKQVAAENMLMKVKDVLPQIADDAKSESSHLKAISYENEEIVNQYIQIRPYTKPKQNVGIKVKHFHTAFMDIIKEKELDINMIRGILEESDEKDCLSKILEHLELDYGITLCSNTPLIMSLTITINVPFTVFGFGENQEEAIKDSIKNSVNYLRILLN